MNHVKIEKLCRRRSAVWEASENVSNVSRQFLIWLIELRPDVLRGGGLGLLLQDFRLLLYFLFLFQEGKVYENAGKQTNRYVSNQSSGESENRIGKRKESECPFSFERWKTDDRATKWVRFNSPINNFFRISLRKNIKKDNVFFVYL